MFPLNCPLVYYKLLLLPRNHWNVIHNCFSIWYVQNWLTCGFLYHFIFILIELCWVGWRWIIERLHTRKIWFRECYVSHVLFSFYIEGLLLFKVTQRLYLSLRLFLLYQALYFYGMFSSVFEFLSIFSSEVLLQSFRHRIIWDEFFWLVLLVPLYHSLRVCKY